MLCLLWLQFDLKYVKTDITRLPYRWRARRARFPCSAQTPPFAIQRTQRPLYTSLAVTILFFRIHIAPQKLNQIDDQAGATLWSVVVTFAIKKKSKVQLNLSIQLNSPNLTSARLLAIKSSNLIDILSRISLQLQRGFGEVERKAKDV